MQPGTLQGQLLFDEPDLIGLSSETRANHFCVTMAVFSLSGPPTSLLLPSSAPSPQLPASDLSSCLVISSK